MRKMRGLKAIDDMHNTPRNVVVYFYCEPLFLQYNKDVTDRL